jgi:dolichol-phosphate mannosyltransferase
MTDNDGRILVTLATYNEIENLPRLVEEIFRVAPQVDVLVIDDNSPDGTGRWCDERAAEEPRLRCLHRPGKLGLGTATLAGFQDALDRGYRYVLNMDADFSHPPRYLPELLAAVEPPNAPPVDVVIGSRYVAGGGVEGWPLRRRLASRAVNAYARAMLGLPVRDCTGSFRCYRAEALRQLDFSRIRSSGYSYLEEILWLLARQGCRFREVPITFVDRQHGRSKIDAQEALRSIRVLLRLGVKNWLGM